MKKLIFATLALAALASCSKENDVIITPTPAESGVALFKSSITRVSGTSWESDDQVGIFATDTTTSLTDYKFNALYDVNTSTSAFTAATDDDKFYYPADSSYIHFYAYYPYSSAVTVDNQYYPINVATQDTPKLIDFMEATTKNDGDGYNKLSDAVALSFNRRMTKISMKLQHGDGIDLAKLTEITLEGF